LFSGKRHKIKIHHKDKKVTKPKTLFYYGVSLSPNFVRFVSLW
jgi:hypothetical protein